MRFFFVLKLVRNLAVSYIPNVVQEVGGPFLFFNTGKYSACLLLNVLFEQNFPVELRVKTLVS
jgi:hypothetical protein